MLRLTALAGIVFLAAAQDPADKVKALIERLDGDEIAEREAAQTELIKLGSAAVPALKERLARAVGEVKPRIQEILARIERNEKIANLLSPGPLVTLSAKERPAAEVFAEIGKQGRLVVESRDLPAGTIVSIEAKGATPAAAIDDLCKAHSKLMYSWAGDRVVIFAAPYRRVPSFDRGPYRLIMDGISALSFGRPPATPSVTFGAGIVGPAGRMPKSATLVFETLTDDKSGDLLAEGPVEIQELANEYPLPEVKGPEVYRGLAGTFPKPLALDGTRVTCRGYASLKFPLDLKRRVTVPAPAAGAVAEDENLWLGIRQWDRSERRVRVSWRRIDRRSGPTPASRVFALEDAKGSSVEGSLQCRYPSGAAVLGRSDLPSVMVNDETYEFLLPEGFEPAKLAYSSVEAFEEVRIPFEIKEALR